MLNLIDIKEELHKCSKCGLCQAECPIYKITGNDCAVSRGLFIMLKAVIDKKLKLSKKINRYLNLCLKCGACEEFCPSGIKAVDIITIAKAEYFKKSLFEKLKTFFQKHLIFSLIPSLINIFRLKEKSKSFDKKVVYFGGCYSKIKSNKALVKILNKINIEVITPKFACCGIPFFSRGDLQEYNNSIKSYIKILKKNQIKDVIVTCASCEKSLKDYIKWADDNDREFLKTINIKNVYEYLKEHKIKLKLKKDIKATYHKPCNINNYDEIEWLLCNIDGLEYVKMQDFDKCCGVNGLFKFQEYKILKNIFYPKRKNIINTNTKIVLTSCFGCEIALKSYSLNNYKVYDLIEFIAKNI